VGLSAPLRYALLLAWGALGGTGVPRMRVLQDPAAAIQTLARLPPDSVWGSTCFQVPGRPRPLTIFWGQAADGVAVHDACGSERSRVMARKEDLSVRRERHTPLGK
jgi:hypothetical protein